jgi:hypothetical protein
MHYVICRILITLRSPVLGISRALFKKRLDFNGNVFWVYESIGV